jgi:predicted dehydrogenase
VLLPEHGIELSRLATQYNVVVTCVHNWIQAPILLQAAALARSASLGFLQHIDMATLRTQPAAAAGSDGNWRVDPRKAGGGILFDHGWHGMSILLRMVGAAPIWVRGTTEKRRYRDLSVEDYGESKVTFANGVTGRFMATWAASERRNDLTLTCSEGRIVVRNDTLQVCRGDTVVYTEQFDESLAAGGYRPAWTAGVVREFKQEIDAPHGRGGTLHEALTALQMLMATYESSRLGGRQVAMPGAAGLPREQHVAGAQAPARVA